MGPIQRVGGKLVNEHQEIEDLGRLVELADKKRLDAKAGVNLPDDHDLADSPMSPALAGRRETRVFLFHGFWLGQFEVTRREWKQIMETEPWEGRKIVLNGDDYPATYISWNGATEFCRLLTERERETGRLPQGWEYTLPTDAQWERACRAGTTTRYSFGDYPGQSSDYAWFDQQVEAYPHRVGQKKPNAWGLHDMHGNVNEWCRDCYVNPLPGGREPVVTEGKYRVQRGGDFRVPTWGCSSGARGRETPELKKLEFGFRVALCYVE